MLRGVHFDFDKANIRSDSVPILREAAGTLKENQYGNRRPRDAAASPGPFLAPTIYGGAALLLLAVLLACALHVYLYRHGFYSISWDESGRILDAERWTTRRDDLLGVGPWLPFYRIVVGLGLELHRDLFLTPRVISFAFGIACMLAVTWLTHEMFHSLRLTLACALLAAIFPERVALALAPLSCIMFITVIVVAVTLALRWLRGGRRRDLLLCAAVFSVSGTIRYEGWFFSACFYALVVGAGMTRGPRVTTADLALIPLITGAFPALWLTLLTLKTGSAVGFLHRTVTTPFALNLVVLKSPLVEFVRRNIRSLNLLGLFSAFALARTDRAIRQMLLMCTASLLLVSAVLLISSSAQTGPSWRMTGVWSTLLLPFTSHFLLSLGARVPHPRRRSIASGSLVLLLFAAFALQIEATRRASGWAFPASDRRAGIYLNRELSQNPEAHVLIESFNYIHLNVLVASQHPQAFVWNTSPGSNDPPVIATDGPVDLDALAGRRIRLFLFRSPAYQQLLDHTARVRLHERFGAWRLYGATPP